MSLSVCYRINVHRTTRRSRPPHARPCTKRGLWRRDWIIVHCVHDRGFLSVRRGNGKLSSSSSSLACAPLMDSYPGGAWLAYRYYSIADDILTNFLCARARSRFRIASFRRTFLLAEKQTMRLERRDYVITQCARASEQRAKKANYAALHGVNKHTFGNAPLHRIAGIIIFEYIYINKI